MYREQIAFALGILQFLFHTPKNSDATLSKSRPQNIWSSQLLPLMLSTPGVLNYFLVRPGFISRKLREKDL